jgi:V/A-type H+-transporting ATPase subunit E
LAIDDILRALEEKAEARLESIKMDTQMRVNEVMAKAEKDAARTKRLRLKKVQDSIRSEATAVVYSASLKAKNELIKAQDETVDDALRRTEQKLLELHKADSYPEILKTLIDECLGYITGEVVLQVRSDDQALVEKLMKEKQVAYRIDGADLSASGGLVASSADGKIVVDNTFDSRLEKARDKLRLEIAQTLFGS